MSNLNLDKKIVIIHEKDNVATATQLILANQTIAVLKGNLKSEIVVSEDIPLGHKVSLIDIPKDAPIIKYGEIIGKAMDNLKIGTMVHIHNVESLRGRGDLSNKEDSSNE